MDRRRFGEDPQPVALDQRPLGDYAPRSRPWYELAVFTHHEGHLLSALVRRFILSAHRGLNEVIVYRHPEMVVHARIPFPSIRGFFPEHIGILGDPRLGFHHTTLSTATVSA